MPKITITETDTTSSASTESVDYAVYVPGFSLAAVNPAAAEPDFIPSTEAAAGASTGVPAYTPIYCSTMAEFRYYFGSIAPAFKAQQSYPELSSDSAGFAENAIPNEQMFDIGAVDAGYLYAEELLHAGIPVIYERMNKWDSCNSDMKFVITTTSTIPTTTTTGTVGQYLLYVNSATSYQDLYICTNVITTTTSTSYVWQVLEHACAYTVTSEGVVEEDFDITVGNMYEQLYRRFVTEADVLTDKSAFNIRYLTAGGYPTFEYCVNTSNINTIATGMTAVAEVRGDCVAIIDHTNHKYRNLTGVSSVYSALNNEYSIDSSYGAMFTPWVRYNGTYVSGSTAPSIAYLTAYATSVSAGNAEWLAIAGKSRGMVAVTALNCSSIMTQAIAESFVPTTGISLNPIVRIGNTGFVIWGNRTLKANTGYNKATSYLNLRMLVNALKRTIYEASVDNTFEQNSDVLWVNYKALITNVLDNMVATYGISDYVVTKLATDDRTKIAARVTIVPTFAVENFEINVYLTDDDIVSEELN